MLLIVYISLILIMFRDFLIIFFSRIKLLPLCSINGELTRLDRLLACLLVIVRGDQGCQHQRLCLSGHVASYVLLTRN